MNKTQQVQSPGAFAWGNYEGFTFVESGRDKKEPRLCFTICRENSTGDFYRIYYLNAQDGREDEGCWYYTNQIHKVEMKEVEVTLKVKDWMNAHE
jgi:hypothetical protein